MKKSVSIPKETIEKLEERQTAMQKVEGNVAFSKVVTLHLDYALAHRLDDIAPYLEVNM